MDEVDWAGLTHAYGTAEDVPGLIRGLLSPDADERHEVRHELYSCIVHQGSRYPATAAAVPFLLELVADPETPDRGELIDFLEYAATGREQQTWKRYPVEELRTAAYDAVALGVPLFAELTADEDAEIAGPAAQALAVFPEHARYSEPVLAALAADDDAPVLLTTTALLALGAVATGGHDGLLRRRLGDDDEDLRWAAALTAGRLRRRRLLPAATEVLRAWSARLVGHDGGVRETLALDELAELDPEGHAARLDPVLDRMLAETPTSNWHNHLISVLSRAGMLTMSGPVAWEDLDVSQRRLVDRICERPEIFAGGAQMPFGWAGLPDTLDGLRRYAGR